MLFVAYPPCSTCKRAMNWLNEHGYTYQMRNIRENPPTYEELKQWHEKSGKPLRSLFNTSGILYREMGLKERLDAMDDEQQLRILASNGMLVKRPVLVDETHALFGFREAEWQAVPKGD